MHLMAYKAYKAYNRTHVNKYLHAFLILGGGASSQAVKQSRGKSEGKVVKTRELGFSKNKEIMYLYIH